MRAPAYRAGYGCLSQALLVLLLLASVWNGSAPVAGQVSTSATGECLVPSEPNDQPPEATVLPDGEACATASSAGAAQDLYRWTVTDEEAATRWTIGVSAVPEQVTRLEVYTVELDAAGAVVNATKLVSAIGQPDQAVSRENLLWAPGTYYIGVATSGPGSYTLTVEAGATIPAPEEPDGAVTGAFERSATSDGSVSWTLDEANADTRWTLRLQGVVAKRLTLRMADANGATALTVQVGEDGIASVPDVGLPLGAYTLSVTGSGVEGMPWVLSAVADGARSAGEEDEPNDVVTAEMPLVFDGDAAVVSGRLAMRGPADRSDLDIYRLVIDPEHAGRFTDIRLLWQGEGERRLCLLDDAGNELKCVTGAGGVSLQDFVLAAGEYDIAIQGLPAPDVPYLLRVEVTGGAVTGFETEPNDQPAMASALAPDGDGFAGGGRLVEGDVDHFHVTIQGDPQLWRIDAEVPGTAKLDLLDSTGSSLMRGVPVEGGLAIFDAYLVPGDHVMEVSGSGADYRVAMTPLGPPDPQHEREPNDTVDRSQPLRLMEERTGRLPTAALDSDVYRFSLQATTYVQVDLDVPADGAFTMAIDWQGTEITTQQSVEPGSDISFSGLLDAGDYTIWLEAATPSEESYTIDLVPLDPFALPADLEPNGDALFARPMPDSLRVEGVGDPADGHGADADWYTIAPFETATEATLRYTPELIVELFTPGDASDVRVSLSLVPGAEPGEATVSLPADTSILLRVTGRGHYAVALWPSGEQPPAASPAPAEPAVSMSLALDDTPVAAYWTDGQVIEGELAFDNAGAVSREVGLEALIGNMLWRVEFDRETVTLDAGETVVVPVTIHIAPDARADEPVFVAVQATDGDGAASVMAMVTPDRSVVPAQAESWWPLPDGMLGGLDVAWTGLGAAPVTPDDATTALEASLYDSMTTLGTGWETDALSLPAELTVDLAGDEAVPVVGFTIFPGGTEPGVGSQMRNYELALSMDGQSFIVVASGSLAPVATEQAIALEAPVEARYARLRVLSAVSPSTGSVTLGEWSVIAAPGWTPETDLDLAAPTLGGHIVDVQPPLPYPRDADYLLAPDDVPQVIEAPPGSAVSWIVGFQHDRAAQVTGFSWLDPPGSDPARRIERMQVEVSTASPLGPWEPLGGWDVARDGAGSATFALDAPVWARFVRFTGTVPAGDGETVEAELPDVIGVIEREADGDYLSILGAWGGDGQAASFERMEPQAQPQLDADAGDDADAALVLPLGEARTDVAAIGVDEDWYRVEMPEGMSELAVTITGYPAIGVAVAVFDTDGASVPVETSQVEANEVRVAASVDSGATYLLRVTQPPTSVVIAFDTSFSIGVLEPTVYQGLNRFATDVQPEREFVQVLPFGEQLLLPDWFDDPYEIQGAIAAYPRTAISSDAEGAILASTNAFEDLSGTRALILITDGESEPSQEQMAKLWPSLAATGPRIFTVCIAGSDDAARGQDVMQDWATVGGGQFVYVRDQGAMDVAFDRAATELRRPVIYSVVAHASAAPATPTPAPTPTPEPDPTPAPTVTPVPTPTPTALPENGSLVVNVPPAEEGVPVVVSTHGQVAIILDTSGSMLQPLEGGTRADVAKTSLIDLVTNTIPPGTIVSLRTFGDTPDSCETLLAVPAGPLDPTAMSATIAGLPVVNLVRTPIGASLDATLDDLAGEEGPRVVVLVTDGEETCDGDPAAAIEALVDSGIDVRVNIVGFAIDDPALTATFEEWARLGHGQYIDAGNAAELNQAVAVAVLPAFDVVDASGAVVASGQVGGEPVLLPPGSYMVVVHTDPETELAVDVAPGAESTVILPPLP